MNIEVERKAFLSEEQYSSLPALLMKMGAKDLGVNDTNTVFYVTDGAQIKVQHAVSKGTAKIAWKSGGLVGKADRHEIEVNIDVESIDEANLLVQHMVGDHKKYISNQKRHDYFVNGCYVAVKYSKNWGHHIEIDMNVTSQDEVAKARDKIEALSKTIGVILMTDEEESVHVRQVKTSKYDHEQ